MPDIGFGEIVVIVVVALLVFGPDRLPKMAADTARTLRQVRQMAASARKDLVDAAGLEDDPEMAQTLKDLRDLDPRQAMNDVVTDEPVAGGAASAGVRRKSGGAPKAPAAGTPPPPSGPASAGGASPAAGAGTSSGAGSPSSSGAGNAGAPVAPPVVAPAEVDPDWT